MPNKIAITTGDPNGIGAEITIKSLNRLKLKPENVVIVSNKRILDFYGKLEQDYEIVDVDFEHEINVGEIKAECGEFAFRSLETASKLDVDAIVTAPVAKLAMHLAGHNFNGQTEVIEHFLKKNDQHAEMLFVAKDFRVLLLTRHCALKEIALNKEIVMKKISDLNEFFQTKLKIETPSFALCAINPHAGEGGILGSEEKDFLIPACEELICRGINLTMPRPADTLFIDAAKAYVNGQKLPYDCYIACYHDQGLIPIKTIAASKTVNMTIGLDKIRTSPSHGCAFDIAGKNSACPDSMLEAILAAL